MSSKTWPVKKLGEVTIKSSVGPKIKKSDYLPNGSYPIIDQSKEDIVGYTNNPELLYSGDLPVIIFGDHTLVFKYVDFPFARGADGTKIITPNYSKVEPKFLYYSLLNLNLESHGYARHYKYLRKQSILLPPPKVQKAIAKRLDAIRKLQELNQQEIEKADELFNSSLHKFLKQKRGWQTKKLEEILLAITNGYSGKQNTDYKGLPISRIETIQNFDIDPFRIKYAEVSENDKKRYLLERGDILFSHINSDEHIGKVALFDNQVPSLLHGVNLLRLKVNPKICLPEYLYFYFRTKEMKEKIIRRARRAVNQSSINQDQLKKIIISLPPLVVQHQIVKRLDTVRKYQAFLRQKKEKLSELFASMLNKAMKGKLVN